MPRYTFVLEFTFNYHYHHRHHYHQHHHLYKVYWPVVALLYFLSLVLNNS